MSSTQAPIVIPRPPDLPEPPPSCPNCGAPRLGRWCYACRQDEKSPVRYLPEVIEDLADLAFNIDSRIFRSLRDLYGRPGYMTVQYFLGHRARYVSAFRLFLLLCILAFLAIQMSMVSVNFETTISPIEAAQSPAEVTEQSENALAVIHASENLDGLPANAKTGMAAAERKVRETAKKQLAWIRARDAAIAASTAVPAKPGDGKKTLTVNGKEWDPELHPLHIDWLPNFFNR